MVTALDNNQRLWVMIKTLMKSKTSRLPEETKNNLIKLADYVAQNTIKLGQDLNNIDNKMLDSFININRQIAEGLLGHR
jgi:flagellar biosynthesis regulator FlaF